MKKDLPVKYRKIKGYVEYKFVTRNLPWYDLRRFTKFGWHMIWIFKADPIDIRDADAPEHYYAFTDLEAIKNIDTYNKLHKYIENINAVEERRFLDAVK